MNTFGQSEHILIQKALVADPNSSHKNKRLDILIESGKITQIGKKVNEPFGSTVVSGKELVVSPGWLDLQVNIPDPGHEYKEDVPSALRAASVGGFTAILNNSDSDPAIDGKSGVEYLLKHARGHLTELFVAGTLSKGRLGKEISEMYDMHRAGARAFCDFKSPVVNTQLLKLALLYAKSFNGLIMVHPIDPYLSNGFMVHEGAVGMENGLKGMPPVAEEIAIERAIRLAEYTGQRLHFTTVSTIEGLELIRKTKKNLQITVGVCAANLLFKDEVTASFDTNFKLNPPLRDEKTRKHLLRGIEKGQIDVVVSDHWPQNVENKDCEFELAEFGMNSLETAYSMLQTAMGEKLEPMALANLLSVRPREILGLEIPRIEKGENANCTVYQPKEKWKFKVEESESLSRNISLNDKELTGIVRSTIRNDQYFLRT